VLYCVVFCIVRLCACHFLIKGYMTWLDLTSSPNIDRFSTFFTVTLGRKFAIKRSLHIQPKLKGVATLPCEILVSKNCSDWQHMHARTHCEGMWPWLASCCQATMTRQKFNVQHVAQSAVERSFSSWRYWFEVFKETPAGELAEANCHARLIISSKQLLNDVIIIWFMS